MTTGKRLDRRTIVTVCLVAALWHPAFWRILPVGACLQWNRRRSLQWGEVLLYIKLKRPDAFSTPMVPTVPAFL
ncbi:hypothetical protein COCMIDRAFT_96911 [Bipolaris oryzae ATCC 44560]|uniref:Uncharacterized protein n=1 Tax=Bipolaris oryzae ATCC 44560 TaxID=930090 RepID=W6ZBV9_COCMI|nr:uncharacterized protein COCMIDRAFT_96911 [Bipolaris oryzae ATCC 44560]EUC44929.1 hypothetical protein COCMIDRAFT_96911 [Bipolaris oryzae ATCC 44560]